jgi:hypothetical protein
MWRLPSKPTYHSDRTDSLTPSKNLLTTFKRARIRRNGKRRWVYALKFFGCVRVCRLFWPMLRRQAIQI